MIRKQRITALVEQVSSSKPPTDFSCLFAIGTLWGDISNQPLTILQTNAVIDGAVKFAPGTIFQQPPNTKSQTLLGCFKQAIPLQDFVLGGSAANKKEKESVEDGESELGVRWVSSF